MCYLWLFCLWIGLPVWVLAQEKQIELYFFYSPTCEHCLFVKDTLLPSINEKYGKNLRYIWMDIDSAHYYEKLCRIEHYLNRPQSDYPIIVFADTILGTREEIEPELENLIARNLLNQLYTIQDSTILAILHDTATIIDGSQVNSGISVIYFNNPKCPHCSRVEKCLEYLTQKYSKIKITYFSDKNSDDLALLEAFNKIYKVDARYHLVTPALFIGDSVLINDEATDNRIIQVINHYIPGGTGDKLEEARPMVNSSSEDIIARFKNFGVLAIILAGLFDGVNPCAFTTIIFFVSYLSFIGRKKKDILIVGFSFSLSVFLTYFLIGLGTLKILIYLQIFEMISRIIIGATGLLAIVLSVVSIYNFFKVRQGQENQIALQLPKIIKQKIHQIIRNKTKISHLSIGAMVVGFFVSIFELACTGQVYLPTITFVVHHPAYRVKGIFLLFLYNLMFILPLVVIFMLVYSGVSSRNLSEIWKKHLDIIEIMLAIIFLFLGIWLIYSIL